MDTLRRLSAARSRRTCVRGRLTPLRSLTQALSGLAGLASSFASLAWPRYHLARDIATGAWPSGPTSSLPFPLSPSFRTPTPHPPPSSIHHAPAPHLPGLRPSSRHLHRCVPPPSIPFPPVFLPSMPNPLLCSFPGVLAFYLNETHPASAPPPGYSLRELVRWKYPAAKPRAYGDGEADEVEAEKAARELLREVASGEEEGKRGEK